MATISPTSPSYSNTSAVSAKQKEQAAKPSAADPSAGPQESEEARAHAAKEKEHADRMEEESTSHTEDTSSENNYEPLFSQSTTIDKHGNTVETLSMTQTFSSFETQDAPFELTSNATVTTPSSGGSSHANYNAQVALMGGHHNMSLRAVTLEVTLNNIDQTTAASDVLNYLIDTCNQALAIMNEVLYIANYFAQMYTVIATQAQREYSELSDGGKTAPSQFFWDQEHTDINMSTRELLEAANIDQELNPPYQTIGSGSSWKVGVPDDNPDNPSSLIKKFGIPQTDAAGNTVYYFGLEEFNAMISYVGSTVLTGLIPSGSNFTGQFGSAESSALNSNTGINALQSSLTEITNSITSLSSQLSGYISSLIQSLNQFISMCNQMMQATKTVDSSISGR